MGCLFIMYFNTIIGIVSEQSNALAIGPTCVK
jgi:hypothetical protein